MSLKATREEVGMSQTELAEKSGVSVRMIQHYEQGFKNINKASVMTVLKLAEAMGADIYEIINERTDAEMIPSLRVPKKKRTTKKAK